MAVCVRDSKLVNESVPLKLVVALAVGEADDETLPESDADSVSV